MKLHIYQLAIMALTVFTMSSCKDTDIMMNIIMTISFI